MARFPFTIDAALAVTHPRIRAVIAREPQYAHFYQPDHPARGMQLTSAIMESFWREARAMGRVGIPLVMPTGLDIEYFRRTGRWPYASLVTRLRQRHIPVVDLGPRLEEGMRDGALAAFFAGGDVARHLNRIGNRLVAEAVEAQLRSNGLLPDARAGTEQPP